MTRACRNQPRCRREALPESPFCGGCVSRLLTAAFGGPQRERVYVQRLSEQDEFCVSVSETSREKAAA